MFPKVTIIWRPNVGKSSFFNMYTGHKIAIVADEPGTTRDVSEFEFKDEVNKLTYLLCDSGGLDFWSNNEQITRDIIERTQEALKESDLLIWILEYNNFSDQDRKILQILKKEGIEDVLVVANKADNEKMEMEAMSLAGTGGFEHFFITSTTHHKWFDDVKKLVAKLLKKKWFKNIKELHDENALKLAVIGRPNVGKSSIVNTILWKKRVVVSNIQGTTRDSIDTKITYEGKKIILIDTAGIRRLSKVGTRNIENWSVMRTQRALKRADIVAVVIDWFEWITQQDLSIISQAVEEKKWVIIVVNKWDLVLAKKWINKENIMDRYIVYLKEKLDFLSWASVIFTSATEKKRVNEILERATEIMGERGKRVKTSVLNDFMQQVTYKHAPTGNKKSHNPKILYATQVDIYPPKFILSVNNSEHFHFSYLRYLENRIRETFGFEWTPIIIELKSKTNPYYQRKMKKNW